MSFRVALSPSKKFPLPDEVETFSEVVFSNRCIGFVVLCLCRHYIQSGWNES